MLASNDNRFMLNSIPFSVTDLDGAIKQIHEAASMRQGAHVHFCNAYTLACADRDPTLHDVLRGASMNLADGASVVAVSRFLGQSLPQRVAGPDVMCETLRRSNGLRHYFMGSTPSTVRALIANAKLDNPQLQIAGHECPPFRRLAEHEKAEQIQRLRNARPDIVWVGLGTPKQEFEAARIAAQVPVVAIAVGAAFDFMANTRRRAPYWVRRIGLEWVFRLAQEPRRMWRRYLFGNARFTAIVIAEVRTFRARAGNRRRSGARGRDDLHS